MTLKFFPPARAVVSALSVALLCSGGGLLAQSPAPATPSPTPRKPAGWVRFWNMLPTSGGRLELVSAADPSKVLYTAGNMNTTADYNELTPGKYTLQVFRAGDRLAVVKNLDVSLRDGTYVTILAREPASMTANTQLPSPTTGTSPTTPPASAPISVELIEDTPPDPAKADNRLTIYQFVPGARVIVSTASKQVTNVLNYGDSQTLSGLPTSLSPLVARATLKAGTGTWNSETDFTANWRSSLLLIYDGYGRFRPRMTSDGPPKPTPTPKP